MSPTCFPLAFVLWAGGQPAGDGPLEEFPPLAMGLFAVALAASLLCIWLPAAWRAWRAQPVPQPRFPGVPWRFQDLMLILVAFLLLPAILFAALTEGEKAESPPAAAASQQDPSPPSADDARGEPEETSRRAPLHPLTRLLMSDASPVVWLVCFASAVLLTPVAEELLFRLLLLGWLGTREAAWRSADQGPASMPKGFLSIVFTALLFGLAHAKDPAAVAREPTISELWRGQWLILLSNGLLVLTALTWLRLGTGARWSELGLGEPARWREDLRRGGALFLASLFPVYGLHLALRWLAPATWMVDPIPLAVLGLLFGQRMYQDWRLPPVVVAHALFNGFAYLLLFLGSASA